MDTLKAKKRWEPPAYTGEICPSCANYVACGYPGNVPACADFEGEES